MNKNLIMITAVALVAALIASSPLAAQQRTRYKLIDMGTFGGAASEVNNGNDGLFSAAVLNNRGELVGWGETPTPDPFAPACLDEKCLVVHAFQWRNGARTDLGTLPGGSSSQANWISQSGLIAGISENGQTDPLVPGFPQTRGVLWRNGHITDLGTLGGYESFANGVNGAGQVVGGALNTVPDDQNSLAAPGLFPTQTRAFLWQDGKMQDLGTLGGPDALAQFINEPGQVVGWSYTSDSPNTSCPPTPDGGGFPLSIGSFIWDGKNKMRNLGTFGGDCTIATGVNNQGAVVGFSVNSDGFQRAFLWEDDSIKDLGGTIGGKQAGAEAINESGQVVGVATTPAGEAVFHATLWRQVGEITDLGVLGQDSCSLASSINSTVQIVGASSTNCKFDNNTSAVLWQDGQIFDLNALIPSGASLHLQWAEAINDRGEIAGTGLDANENLHVFLLIPCDANDSTDCQEVVAGASDAPHDNPVLVMQRPQAADPSHSIGQMLSRPPAILHQVASTVGAASGPSTDAALSIPQASISSSGALTRGITITSGVPPEGTVGKPYGQLQFLWNCSIIRKCAAYYFKLSASGGSGNYSWSWTAAPGSSLPPGLSCCTLSLEHTFPGPIGVSFYFPVIYGYPTTAGTYHVIVTVTDSSSPALHASDTYSITVLQ